MQRLWVGLIVVVAAGLSWILSSSVAPGSVTRSFGSWEAAFLTLGTAWGIAGVRGWKLHERLPRRRTHLVIGATLFGLGVAGTFLLGYESPLRFFAPILTTVGLAWAIIGLAAVRQAHS